MTWPNPGSEPASWPLDPRLAGLAWASVPTRVAAVLAGLGVEPQGLRLEAVAYRPFEAATLRAVTASATTYLKVLPAGAAGEVVARLELLAGAGLPVPAVLGVRDDVVISAGLPGVRLTDVLRGGGVLPSLSELTGLLERLPAAILALPPQPSWSELVFDYANCLAGALPAWAERAHLLAGEVSAGLAGQDQSPVPTHGDFHPGNLLVDDDGHVTGLLDLQLLGPGQRADDLACLLGHALAQAWLGLAKPDDVLATWAPRFAGPLRLRTCAVVLSLAATLAGVRPNHAEVILAAADRLSGG